MDVALRKQWPVADQDQRISEAISRDEPRFRNFIRRRVADQSEAEDILQEVFYELVEAYRPRMMERWDQMTPEEREKMREAMRGGCGPFASRAEETKP